MEKFRMFLNNELPFFSGGIKIWAVFAICVGLVSILVMGYLARRGFSRKKIRDLANRAPLLELQDCELEIKDIEAISTVTIEVADETPTEIGAKVVEVDTNLNDSETPKSYVKASEIVAPNKTKLLG